MHLIFLLEVCFFNTPTAKVIIMITTLLLLLYASLQKNSANFKRHGPASYMRVFWDMCLPLHFPNQLAAKTSVLLATCTSTPLSSHCLDLGSSPHHFLVFHMQLLACVCFLGWLPSNISPSCDCLSREIVFPN